MKLLKKILLILTLMLIFVPFSENVQAASINKANVILIKGQTTKLKIKGNSNKIIWTSNKKSVATVSSKGVVKARKKGTAKITAKIGKKKYTCTIAVQVPKLNKTNLTLNYGKNYTLKLYGTNQKIKWSSSNPHVAVVNAKGKITPKGNGTVKITATVLNKKYSCTVKVRGKKTTPSSNNHSAADYGNVTYSSQSTDYGVVAILKNNYSYSVSVIMTCVYIKNGAMVGKSSASCYALEAGHECALQAWESECEWDDYKITLSVEKGTNLVENVSNIYVNSNFGNENVMAAVTNTGKNNRYTEVAIVYYKNNNIVGYDSTFANVASSGSVDYLEFNFPYTRDYNTIIPDSYKIYVNSSYTYTWLR